MFADNFIKNWDEAKAYFISKYPQEAGGYINNKNYFHPLDNIAEDLLDAFEFDADVLVEHKVKCVIHTHPYSPTATLEHDPRMPSSADLQGQKDTAVEWAIAVTDGVYVNEPIFWGDYDHRPPLMSREFIHNATDCLSFVADWLYKDCGFKMPSFARDPDWVERGKDHFEEMWPQWGFEDVSHLPQQRGDLVLYKIAADVTSHIGVVIEPNLVAHHLPDRLPVSEPYSKWKKFAVRRIRHSEITGTTQ